MTTPNWYEDSNRYARGLAAAIIQINEYYTGLLDTDTPPGSRNRYELERRWHTDIYNACCTSIQPIESILNDVNGHIVKTVARLAELPTFIIKE